MASSAALILRKLRILKVEQLIQIEACALADALIRAGRST